MDLREDPSIIEGLKAQQLSPITRDQVFNLSLFFKRWSLNYFFKKADKMCKELSLAGYVECSALTQKGLKQVFDEAARIVVGSTNQSKGVETNVEMKPLKKKKKCLII